MAVRELATALRHQLVVEVRTMDAYASHMGVHGPQVDLKRGRHVSIADRVIWEANQAKSNTGLARG